MSDSSPFGVPLQPDPAVALIAPVCKRPQPGPVHRAQFVVELVGPRSIAATSANALLQPQWYEGLGRPQVFVLSPADTVWRPLAVTSGGSYDSLALCWDIVTLQGELSSVSGHHLLTMAESFASQVNRRAIPLPPPADLDRTAKTIEKIRANLDVGISMVVLPPAGLIAERDLWVQCSRLGLTFGTTGAFEWRSDDHPSPLFSVTPIGNAERFSLRGVQTETLHEGVTLGFNVPTSPAPMAAVDGLFHAGDVLAQSVEGAVFDPEGQPMNAKMRDRVRRDLLGSVQVLEEVGVSPGSAAALKIFSD
jgi:hypothetical protein